MTKAEFIANQKRIGRRLWLLIAIWIPALTATGVLIETVFAAHRDLAFRVALFAHVAGLFGGIYWIAKKTDLRCPACKKSVQGGVYTPLAIATGKCGHCGGTLFDESPPPETTASRQT